MNCTDFLARHSDYHDGLLETAAAGELRAHVERCPSCARYDRVVRRGTDIARELLGSIELSPDFEARMRHRLYHERDARTRAGSNAMGGVYAAVASVLLVGATAGVLALADSSAPTVDAQVVFAAAPPAMTSLAANAVAVQSPSFDAVPDVDAESVSPNEAEAGGHDPHVASPEGWPVYSRGAAAVAFPVSHTTLVIRPADFRPMTARAPVAPILVRH